MGLGDYASMPEPAASMVPPPEPAPAFTPAPVASYQPPPPYSPVPQVSEGGAPATPQPQQGIAYPGASGSGSQGAPPRLPPAIAQALADQDLRRGGGPARMQPSGETTTREGVDLPPAYVDAFQALTGASREQAEAHLAGAQAQGVANAEQQTATMAYDAKMQQAQEARAAEIKAASDRDYQAVQNTQTAAAQSANVDPHRWWSSKSDFGKVATGITMMLQGFMFGMGRGADPAQWLNQQIRNDVDDQKSQHAAKQQAANDAINVFHLHREKLGDDERATLAAEMTKRAQVIAMLQQKANDVSAPAMGRMLVADTAQKLAADQLAQQTEFVKLSGNKYTTAITARMAGGGAAPTNLERLQRAGAIQAATDKLTGASAEGRQAEANVAKTEAEAKKLGQEEQGDTASHERLIDTVSQIRAMVLKGGEVSHKATGAGQALMAQFYTDWGRANGQPAIVRGKLNPLLAMAAGTEDPNEFQFSDKTLATLDKTAELAGRNLALARSKGADKSSAPASAEAEGGD